MRNKPKGARSAPQVNKAKPKAGRAKANADRRQAKKLGPGQLDGLVIAYMKKHKGELPISPTTVARGIRRSSGAVGNCLGRLDQAGKVRLANKKPRRYDLADSTKERPTKTSGPRRRGHASRGPDHKEAQLLMADVNPTGARNERAITTWEEDESGQRAVLRLVLEFHPDALTQDELIRELTGGGESKEASIADPIRQAVRELASAGLLHRPGDEGFVRVTRTALRYFELTEEVS